MTTAFRKSFVRDLKKIQDRTILDQVRRVIEQVEAASTPHDLGDFKKMSGTEDHYRIHVGEYRIGVVLEDKEAVFVHCLPKRGLYRFFS